MPSSEPRHPANRWFLGAVGAVQREEWPFALLMFSYILLVISTFWILKPLKKGLFIQFYDQRSLDLAGRHFAAAEAELLAKVLNMVVAFVAVAVFTWLARRLRRERLTAVLMTCFVVAEIAFAWLLRAPGSATVWSFYLFGDLFSTLMVAAFFAFLNDSVTADAAKRLYGFIGLGAVLGGVIGSSVIGAWIGAYSAEVWLYVCAAIDAVVIAIAMAAGTRAPVRNGATAAPSSPSSQETAEHHRNPAFEGAALVMRSPYLLSIAAIVGAYEIVSTVMDFQFTSAVSAFLDGDAIPQHLSHVFAVTNVVSMLVQLFLTSTVMQTWGVGVALAILPLTSAAGSVAFFAHPSLWTGSVLNTADNAFSYSINQSAKEALYVPVSTEEKYAAKAFIDMFVQRAAKTLAVVISLAAGAWFKDFDGVRWLSVAVFGLIGGWMVAVRRVGREEERRESP